MSFFKFSNVIIYKNDYEYTLKDDITMYHCYNCKDEYKCYDYPKVKEFYQKEYDAFQLIAKYLNGYVIGLSCGSRERDILNLLKEGHKVIAFDDIDLYYTT